VLKCLKPHSDLEELSIKHYNGSFSPTWSGWLPLDRLASIELKDCHNCEELPPLGCLPSLKHILVQSLPRVKLVGPEFFGDVADIASSSDRRVCNVFPALESLKFRNMKAWEEWCGVKSEHFPNLRYLSIARCSKLKLLPKFTSEPKLRIRHCDLLQMQFCQVIFETSNDCYELIIHMLQFSMFHMHNSLSFFIFLQLFFFTSPPILYLFSSMRTAYVS